MIAPPRRIIHDPDVLPAVRSLFDQRPAMTRTGSETLSRALFVMRYVPYRPEPFAVEMARGVR
jgi:hypothetical protein